MSELPSKEKLPNFRTPTECGQYRNSDQSRQHRGTKQWLCEKCERWCWRNDMCNLFVARPNKNGELP